MGLVEVAFAFRVGLPIDICVHISISGTFSAQSIATFAPAQAARQQALKTQPSPDTVILSQSAQVSQLNELGQSPLQIAGNLGMPVSSVDSDLGIVATNAAAAAP